MGTSARRLLIAAIHHGEWPSAPGAQVLAAARSAFQETGWQVATIEVVEQPPLESPWAAGELGEHRRRQRTLERRWRAHLQQSSTGADLQAGLAQAVESIALRLSAEYRQRTDRARQIQALVTEKHCRAFAQAQTASVDWLLVLESDATLRPESPQGLADLAQSLPSGGAWFVDLAGGIDALEGQHVVRRIPETNLVRLDPPVTNTACAYLISRDMVTYLVEYRHANPGADEWAIDWFVNAAFMAAQDRGAAIDCARHQPRLLDHGSFTGMTTSWRSTDLNDADE